MDQTLAPLNSHPLAVTPSNDKSCLSDHAFPPFVFLSFTCMDVMSIYLFPSPSSCNCNCTRCPWVVVPLSGSAYNACHRTSYTTSADQKEKCKSPGRRAAKKPLENLQMKTKYVRARPGSEKFRKPFAVRNSIKVNTIGKGRLQNRNDISDTRALKGLYTWKKKIAITSLGTRRK
jgi:hypothetical protein